MKPNDKVLPIFLVANLRWQSVSRKINYNTDCLQKVSNLFYFCENNHLRVIYCVLCEWSIFILSFIYSILCTFCGTWRNVKIYFLKNEQMNSFLSSFSDVDHSKESSVSVVSEGSVSRRSTSGGMMGPQVSKHRNATLLYVHYVFICLLFSTLLATLELPLLYLNVH